MLRHFRNSARFLCIAWKLARHDALFPLQEAGVSPVITNACRIFAKRSKERPGLRLARALQELGPTFIKLGQSLSTRADLVGAEIALDLAQLRDSLDPFPTAQAKRILQEDLGTVSSLFQSFEDKPVAAASIAQVHLAVTAEGKKVAVKIMRPSVREAFAKDLELLFWLAEMAECNPRWKRLKPLEVVQSFATTVKLELDLRFEAGAALELKENMAQDEGFFVPQVYWPLTSDRVLTLEYVDGIPIGDIEALRAAGHDLNQLQRALSESFFKQAFRDGFFHADLHPGNLFVLQDGRIAVVDFGIMGRISQSERIYVAEIFRGFLQEDYRHVAEVHFAAGYVPSHHSVEQFTLACRAIGQPILGRPLNEISVGRLLAQLFQVTENFDMETQPQLLLLQKTLVMLEGVGRMLNPQVNMWQMAEPLIQDWARQHLGPLAQAKMHLGEMRQFLKQLPATLHRAERLLAKIEEGGLPLHPDTIAAMVQERQRQHRDWLLLAWTLAVVLLLLILQ